MSKDLDQATNDKLIGQMNIAQASTSDSEELTFSAPPNNVINSSKTYDLKRKREAKAVKKQVEQANNDASFGTAEVLKEAASPASNVKDVGAANQSSRNTNVS